MTPILYLLMRDDLPSMNPGKLAAQASHAANQFVGEVKKAASAGKKPVFNTFRKWEAETGKFFGTTIVLAASLEQIKEVSVKVALFSNREFIGGEVVDPTYPCEMPFEVAKYLMDNEKISSCTIGISNGRGFMLRSEVVGSYLFGDKDDPMIQSFVEEFRLYP